MANEISAGGVGGGSGESVLGFDLPKADELVGTIADTWRSIVLYEKDAFHEVQKVLQEEWVGPDEQKFEQRFTLRLKKLYEMTEETVSQTTRAVAVYATTWAEWQAKQNNVTGVGISPAGDESAIESKFLSWVEEHTPNISSFHDIGECVISDYNGDEAGVLVNKIKKWLRDKTAGAAADYEVTLTFKERDYTTGFRGLTNGTSSATNIQNAVETFVAGVRAKTQNLFDSISVSDAFYGSQTTTIKGYIENASACVEDISTAVKDLNDALSLVAGTNYTSKQEEATQNLQAAQQSMSDNTANALADSRWD